MRPRLLSPPEHRQLIQHICQIGTMPTRQQIRRAYVRYVLRWLADRIPDGR